MLKRIDILKRLPEKELISEIYYVLDTIGNHPHIVEEYSEYNKDFDKSLLW